MRTDVIMPMMGMAMRTGVITSWEKKDGDQVTEDEVLCNIETDKLENVIKAPASGTLHITSELNVDIPVAEVIGYID